MNNEDVLLKILEKLDILESNQKDMKRQITRSVAELKAMDEVILDEVERVHEILDNHIKDTKKHSA